MTSRSTVAAVALGFAVMGAGAYLTKAAGQEEGTGRTARVLRTFELPPLSLTGVEENKPSIFVGDIATGVVQKRYTPSGTTLSGAGYDVSDTLPAVLVNRRNNRGFEAVALSTDGRTAYTATQSPLGSTTSGSPYRDSRVVRILRIDVSDPLNAFVTGQFVLQMSAASEYPAGTRQRDLKLSAMAWLAEDRLLFLERSDEVAKGDVRLIVADLREATNIEGLAIATTLQPEDVSPSFSALGVAPVSTRLVFDEFETDAPRQFWTYKLEGMAILNRNEVAIINDNDFGILDASAPTNLWVLRLGEPLR